MNCFFRYFMITFVVLLLILSFPWLAHSQVEAIDTTLLTGLEYEVNIEVYPYSAVEEKPEYPGGMKKLNVWFEHNSHYSRCYAKAGIEGKVFCEVIIDTLGKVLNPRILENAKYIPHPKLIKETLRLINKLPLFTSGKIKGQKVKTIYVFQLYYNPPTPLRKKAHSNIICIDPK